MSEDIQLDKLRMLLDAIETVEDAPDFLADLKEAAWRVLHDNPGCGFDSWMEVLLEQYPAEVVDAIGSHPAEAYASLTDLWDAGDYEDEATGECHAIKDWAEYFATDQSVELYDMLADARREIKRFKARLLPG